MIFSWRFACHSIMAQQLCASTTLLALALSKVPSILPSQVENLSSGQLTSIPLSDTRQTFTHSVMKMYGRSSAKHSLNSSGPALHSSGNQGFFVTCLSLVSIFFVSSCALGGCSQLPFGMNEPQVKALADWFLQTLSPDLVSPDHFMIGKISLHI